MYGNSPASFKFFFFFEFLEKCFLFLSYIKINIFYEQLNTIFFISFIYNQEGM